MNCPVLTELRLVESYEPEHENPPVLSGGDYDIDAIRHCAENCPVDRQLHGREVNDALLAAQIEVLEKDNTRLREALASILPITARLATTAFNLGQTSEHWPSIRALVDEADTARSAARAALEEE